LVAVDTLGLGIGRVKGIQDKILERLGAPEVLPRERLVVASTHSHAVPDSIGIFGEEGVDKDYLAWIEVQAAEAAVQALLAAEEAELVVTHGDAPELVRDIGATGVTSFAMELLPRISRAQSMDALSSMATIAGYKAVLLAAGALPKMFPMLMTAAGTVRPAKVLVVGAGVAGLQAIATAKRLGAVVSAYDIRPAVKEQVESLGARFVEVELKAGDAEGKGGYAKAMTEEFYREQRELLAKVVAENDVVITTAAVPGKKAPLLVTKDMVKGMAPGSVIVDLAAERGGNCELTKADETVVAEGVTILGPTNLPSTVPYHASQMYSKNVSALLAHLVNHGVLELNLGDEITREMLLTHGGEVVQPRVRELLGLPAKASQTEEITSDG
ncbi:MAG: NAD(P) transhydrogenase subunit alpha, partial [Planctomycetes bacterium]|nr:NAD(P) transhydrogenase subunit alpha [Planctomycetota bacterium]